VQAAEVQDLRFSLGSFEEPTGRKWRASVSYDIVFTKEEIKMRIPYIETVKIMEVNDALDEWSYPEFGREVIRTYVKGALDDTVCEFPKEEVMTMGGTRLSRRKAMDIPKNWNHGWPERGDEELVAVVIIEPKYHELDIAYSSQIQKDIGEDPADLALPYE